MRIIASKHFIGRLGERQFDLTFILELSRKIKNTNKKTLKIASGNTQAIVEWDSKKQIAILVTGWRRR